MSMVKWQEVDTSPKSLQMKQAIEDALEIFETIKPKLDDKVWIPHQLIYEAAVKIYIARMNVSVV